MSQSTRNPGRSKPANVIPIDGPSEDIRKSLRGQIRDETERNLLSMLLHYGLRVWPFFRDLGVRPFENPICNEAFGIASYLAEKGEDPSLVDVCAELDEIAANSSRPSISHKVREIYEGITYREDATEKTIQRLQKWNAAKQEAKVLQQLLMDCETGSHERDALNKKLAAVKLETDPIFAGHKSQRMDNLADAESMFNDIFDSGEEYTSIETGLIPLDLATGGLLRPGVVLLGGKTGSGKSTLALNFLIHAAECGIKGHAFFLEMKNKEHYARALAYHSGINEKAILSKQVSEDQMSSLMGWASKMTKLAIGMNDDIRTLDGLETAITREALVNKAALFVVDHIGLIEAENYPGENEFRVMERCSKLLNRLAERLKITIILVAHLNKTEFQGGQRVRVSEAMFPGHMAKHVVQAWILIAPEHEHAIREFYRVKDRRAGSEKYMIQLAMPQKNSRYVVWT